MKPIQLLIAFILFIFSAKAQENNKSSNDTLKLKFGKAGVWFIDVDGDTTLVENKKPGTKKAKFTSWQGIGGGMNGLVNANGSTDFKTVNSHYEIDYLKSANFAWNFSELRLPLFRNNLSLTTGLGFDFNSFNFRKPISLRTMGDSLYTAYDSTRFYKENKLRATYFMVPLLLEFNSSAKQSKSFHLAAGVYGGYKISSRTKQIFDDLGMKTIIKQKGDYNLNPFRYGLTARAGYGAYTAYFNYNMSSLFEKDKGPDLYPFTAGISINFGVL